MTGTLSEDENYGKENGDSLSKVCAPSFAHRYCIESVSESCWLVLLVAGHLIYII